MRTGLLLALALSLAFVLGTSTRSSAGPATGPAPGPAPVAAAVPGTDPVGVWPLSPEPEVVTAFDPPATPYAAGHRGVDLLGAVGQPVLAALPGVVTFAGSIAGRGVVVVGHGATRTTYEPVAATVTVGAAVGAGGPIGVLQAAPSHCAPRFCLHWGWLEGEIYLDPLRLVGAGPVRLLPLGAVSTMGAYAGPVAPVTPLTRLLQLRQAVS